MFTGFPPTLFQFYDQLIQNNDRGWWSDHRGVYDSEIRPAMEEFVAELDWRWRPMMIFRPHNNVRFAPSKPPYKTAIGASGGDDDGILHYVQAGAGWVFGEGGSGLRVSRGMYLFSPDQKRRWNEAVDQDTEEYLRDAIWRSQRSGLYVSGSLAQATVPAGYRRDHPRADLLRLGGLTGSYGWDGTHGWLNSRRAISMVVEKWEAADPITEWLVRHVGAAEL